MRKLLLIASMLAMTSAAAEARDFNITIQHRPLAWDWGVHPMAQHLPPMNEAQQTEDARWEAFCQPTRTADDLGVIRLSYAHEGCEFGRSQ